MHSAQTWESRASTAASSPSTVLLSATAGPGGMSTRMAGVSSQNAMAEDMTTRQWNFHVSGSCCCMRCVREAHVRVGV